MGVELIPSITANTAKQLVKIARLAQQISPVVHLDIMDGRFVKSSSAPIASYGKIIWKSRVEIHAMVSNPGPLLTLIDRLNPRRVYLHAELGASLLPLINLLRTRRVDFGLAINPYSPLAFLSPYVKYATSILVMSVQPGRYHAPYWLGTVKRIKAIRRRWPRKLIVCDGSMNTSTIPSIIRAGAKRLVVGSAVMLSSDPQASWQALRALTSNR